ncbi:hypothetical protein Hypma_011340 [Hypsizygus marmoreus]|uniref:Transmembrane protein n=1 Tax=Hypsizygus marmoreus TaxID=39966 RepID=A0A369JH55_HYPMA|nr:hypothetical protein Hypma_011340 [Hypsizygus marmoreus]
MAIISETSPTTVETNSRLLIEVVTTTMYTSYPSAGGTATPGKRGTSVPVAAIVGGVVGGALLAIMVTVGWVCWGKSIKRAQLKEWREADAVRKTRLNTLHNAASSRPHMHSYKPLFPRPVDKKIKFAGHDDDEKPSGWSLNAPGASPALQKGSVPHADLPPFLTRSPAIPKVSKPKPLRSVKGSSHLSTLAAEPNGHLRGQASAEPPLTRIPHKPSTISSASVYSTASGEEHEVRVPPNLIIAALGSLGSSVEAFRNSSGGGDRRSTASSNRSFLWRMVYGLQGNVQSDRYSQASSQSASTAASRDSSGAPIGLAL